MVAAADLPPGAVFHGSVGKDTLLNAGLHGVGELVALAAEDLDAVVLIGIVAGGDDDARVRPLPDGQIGHGGGGNGAHRLHIAAHVADARHQGGLQHIGGDAGVLADHDDRPAARLLCQHCGHCLAHAERLLRRQIFAHDAADAVGPK